MSLLIKFLKFYYQTGWRGSFRLTDILAQRIRSLQLISIQTDSGIVYGDLRNNTSRGLLASPKCSSGEDLVMKQFVKEGDIVFDIGAHLGFYTLLLSNLVKENGKIYAFEPNPELLKVLSKTLNPIENIELHAKALSEKTGETILFIPEDASMASLEDWTEGTAGNVHQAHCLTQRLDDFILEHKILIPNFIKCDVEGAELFVFGGGIKTLNRVDAPILLFEINSKAAASFNKTSKSYFDFLNNLEKAQYKYFQVFPDGLKILKSTEIDYGNILAVPLSKSHNIKI